MNKQEIAVVVGLFLVLLGWGAFQQRQSSSSRTPEAAGPEAVNVAAPADPAGVAEAQETALPPASVPDIPEPVADVDEPVEVPGAPVQETGVDSPMHSGEQELVVLTGEKAEFTFSSWGGGIVSVRLREYRQHLEDDGERVVLDFSSRPALSISGVPGLSTNSDFELVRGEDPDTLHIRGATASGLIFERTVRLGTPYVLEVSDAFVNNSSEAVSLPERSVATGAMSMIRTKAKTRGISYLGIDTLAAHGGEGVMHWGKKALPALFGARTGLLSCAKPAAVNMEDRVVHRVGQPVAWAASKNKFFVQLLAPEEGAMDCELRAARDPEAGGFTLEQVSADLLHPAAVLEPGATQVTRGRYYAGPKKYTLLTQLGNHQSEIMQFGMLRWLCRLLLNTLNLIHGVLPNYGIAIILLTILVRVIFWPVTHKSTESMKKMQQIQPLVSEVRAKYKDKPQKMNQEVMALYKEHKVNPMAGCLPMVIQIPVFIALFTVLRSAVELRFAGFLWISDLSEPEGLLAGLLPGSLTLNILPILMTVTMIWQQRLTPTAGDPQQQKVMAFMPVMFLFLFYSMASALVLYWTTSQCLSIAQLLLQRKRSAKKGEAAVAVAKGKG